MDLNLILDGLRHCLNADTCDGCPYDDRGPNASPLECCDLEAIRQDFLNALELLVDVVAVRADSGKAVQHD